MTELKSEKRAPWHMWVVGILLLVWHGFASFDYIATVIRFEPYLANFPEEILSYFFDAPLWMYAMWGMGSIGGLISTILMLMRRKSAVLIFVSAWVCSMVASIYSVINPMPGGGNNLFMGIVMVVALLIVIYLHWLQRRGVLR